MRAILVAVFLAAVLLGAPALSVVADDSLHVVLVVDSSSVATTGKAKVEVRVFDKDQPTAVTSLEVKEGFFGVGDKVAMTEKGTGRFEGTVNTSESPLLILSAQATKDKNEAIEGGPRTFSQIGPKSLIHARNMSIILSTLTRPGDTIE